LNANAVISDLKRQEIEIITEERLTRIINENPSPTTYIGHEPSSSLHIGNLSSSVPVITLAKHGFRAIILLADLHALANDKGEISEIQEFARRDREMFEHVTRRMGLESKFEFRLGTEFEDQAYFIKMLRLARSVNFTEAEKSMDEISKSSVTRMTSSIIYPLMQVLDIGALGVNVAVGGMAQRKMHVLAIENLKKLGYSTPVAVHPKVVALGTEGKQMMSKSKHNTIDLDETQESLETKIKKTFCAPGDVESNPILSWYRGLIFPLSNKPLLEFGQKSARDYAELETFWMRNEISPQELKKATVRDLGEIIL
jgi:tyrosyl-tRNA synthetase